MNGTLLAAAIAAALIFSNCLIMESETSGDNSEEYVAWAYSSPGCQEMLDKEAGHHVVMTQHTERIVRSVLNLGIVPPFNCHGTVQPQSATAKFGPNLSAPIAISTVLSK